MTDKNGKDTQKRESRYSLKDVTQEEWDRVRREIEEEDIRRCTNSRGEIVPTVFPSND
jgi:hypothetical protein